MPRSAQPLGAKQWSKTQKTSINNQKYASTTRKGGIRSPLLSTRWKIMAMETSTDKENVGNGSGVGIAAQIFLNQTFRRADRRALVVYDVNHASYRNSDWSDLIFLLHTLNFKVSYNEFWMFDILWVNFRGLKDFCTLTALLTDHIKVRNV